MKHLRMLAASIVLAGTLAACDRESSTGTPTPASPRSSTTPDPVTTSPKPDGQSVDYNQALERLHKAAQQLRDSIQALAQKQPGPQRTVAIAMAHNALNATNQAMAQLPPEMRADPAPTTKGGSGSTGSIGSQPDNPQSVEALQKAAEQLRVSIQAMADEPPGERRDAAVKAAHQALYDTNQAMLQLPGRAAEKT